MVPVNHEVLKEEYLNQEQGPVSTVSMLDRVLLLILCLEEHICQLQITADIIGICGLSAEHEFGQRIHMPAKELPVYPQA